MNYVVLIMLVLGFLLILPNWKLIRYEISKVSVYIVLFSNKNQWIMLYYVSVRVLGQSLWFLSILDFLM